MPISYKLTPKQNSIIQFIRNLKTFDEQKLKYRNLEELSSDFKQQVANLISLSKYKGKIDLIAIAFAEEVPSKYVEDETEEMQNFRNPRRIEKSIFENFRNGCGNDEYMFFRFHNNPNSLFSLGYVNQNCDDTTPIKCIIRWFNGEDQDVSHHVNDNKGKKGILHRKDEFDTLINNSGNFIYLHRRRYKQPQNHKSEQTVVLSNGSTIDNSSTFDNVGGSCCPPQF